MKMPAGQVLAHKDYAVKADLHKIERCEFCGGSGYYSEPMLFFKGLGWLLLIVAVAAYVIVKQF